MTTIQQLMQTGPAKANEMFAKLVDTSATAVKMRDRMFSELKVELDRQVEFTEPRLFPVLKKHQETKELVGAALNDNRQTRKLLAEIERSPKEGEVFGAQVTELRDVFQQHLRDDKKELLPAVVKALNDAEASTDIGKAEDEPTEIQPARRAYRGEYETAGAPRPGADIVKAGNEVAQQAAKVARVAAGVGERDRTAQTVTSFGEAHETARETDTAPAGGSMTALLNEQARHAIEAQTTMAIGGARTLSDLTKVQSAFIAGSFERMEQFNDRYLAAIRSWRGLVFRSSDR